MSLNKINEFEKITIYDIKHQDIYDVYKDKKGYYYDISGNLINIDIFLNHNTSYDIEKPIDNICKIKKD
jgi:hypothetical protein